MKHDAKTRRAALRLLARPQFVLADIVAITGVTRRTLQSWARAAGMPPRPRGARPSIYPAKTRRLAVRLYLQGVKMRTIGAATGAGTWSIREWVRAAGHPLRETHTSGRLDTAEVVALAEQHGHNRAAEILGCSPGSVAYHRQRAIRLRVREELRAQDATEGRRRAT